mgnify:CR=1 FL=1
MRVDNEMVAESHTEITRSALRRSRRHSNRNAPLPRDELSEALDDEAIEIPTSILDLDPEDEIAVLHVDDDPDLADLTKLQLEKADDALSVTSVNSPTEALQYLRNRQIDCVVSDYDMPNTDGIEFLKIVREQYPDLPFVLYTGKGSEEVASEAIAEGVTDYMQKETGVEQYEVLANRVHNAVDRYRTQQQFWDALSWYQRLIEQDLAGVFIAQDGEFRYVNERFADISGYPQDELLDRSPLLLTESDSDTAGLRDLVTDHSEVGESFQRELTCQRADGSAIEIKLNGGTIRYDGTPACLGLVWPSGD